MGTLGEHLAAGDQSKFGSFGSGFDSQHRAGLAAGRQRGVNCA